MAQVVAQANRVLQVGTQAARQGLASFLVSQLADDLGVAVQAWLG